MTLRTFLVAGVVALAPAGATAQVSVLASAAAARPAPADARWSGAVTVDIAALEAAAAGMEPVVLELAPGISVTTIPEHVAWRGRQRFTWFGEVAGGGRATLTVERSRVYGRVVTAGRAIMIEPSGDVHVVYEAASLDADGDGFDALPAPAGVPRSHDGDDELFPDELHVALFYTSQVADSLGDAVDVFLQATVDQLTDVLANSNVDASARLVYGGEVVHTETTQLSGNLSAFQDPTDGDMDEVHDIRNAVSADMMALLVETGVNSATGCGVAYLMGSLDPGFESAAFSVTKRRCAPELVFSHEVGHNLGLHHDTYVAPGPGLFDYSHGFVNIDSMNSPPGRPGFRTPLAYHSRCADSGGECPRIPFFSSPDMLYEGQAMGDAATADNARTVRQSAVLAATFRAPELLDAHVHNSGGSPTWQRPECPDPVDMSSCALSGTATSVSYTAREFSVTQSGRYYVSGNAAFEGVLLLYDGAFDPGSPLAGLVGYAEPDPSAPPQRRLLLAVEAAAGVPYVLVTTGVSNADAGAYTNKTYGPTGAGVIVASEGGAENAGLVVGPAAPNPTNETATIRLSTGHSQFVRAEIFDALGRRVATLLDGWIAAGASTSLTLDAGHLAPGVYVLRVAAEREVVVRRITVSAR